MTREPKGEPALQSTSSINAFLPDIGLCCLSREIAGIMSRCTFRDGQGQVQPALVPTKDSRQSSEHKWMRLTLVRACCRLISLQMAVAKKACLQTSSMSQLEAELRLPHMQNSQSRGYAALTHIANCPSNVRWRRLQTVRRFGDMTQCDQCD